MGSVKTRSAAVTGAGSGLGRDIALGLATKDYRVFGAGMTDEEVTELQQASGARVTLTRCDITDRQPASICSSAMPES